MISHILPIIQSYVVPAGALGIFLACFLDEISLVIPATVVLIATGFFFLHGPLSQAFFWHLLFFVALPAAAGLTLGASVIYTLAYIGGKPAIEAWGKYVGVSWSDIEAFDDKISKSSLDEWFIFLAWVLPILPSALLNIFCGTTRIPPREYVSLTFAGTLVKAIFMTCIGYAAGELYFHYAETIDRFETLIGLLIVAGIIIYVISGKKKSKVLE